MDRVFVDSNGRYYKAEVAASKGDSEKPVGTADFMAVLSSTPRGLEELQQAMHVAANSPAVQADITIATADSSGNGTHV